MPSTYSPLKIELMATGENSGTWGNVTNINLGTALEEAITGSADVTFASADVTLTLTDTNATQAARNLRLNLTGTAGASPRNLIVPAIEKLYLVNNGLLQTITVKNSTGTGIAIPAGKTTYVYNDGTNVVDAITHLSSLTVTGNLGVGTSSPSGKLDVQTASSTILNTSTTGTNTVRFISTNTGGSLEVGIDNSTGSGNFGVGAYVAGLWYSGNYPLVFATNNTERMRLDSSGNLGLGVTPSAWNSGARAFQIGSQGAVTSSGNGSTLSTNYLYDTSGAVKYIANGYATVYQQNAGQHQWFTAPSGTAGNAISFTQAMTLDASGNLGVGTTSPGAKFQTAGNFTLGGNSVGNCNIGITGADSYSFTINGVTRLSVGTLVSYAQETTSVVNIRSNNAAGANMLSVRPIASSGGLQVVSDSGGLNTIFVLSNNSTGTTTSAIYGDSGNAYFLGNVGVGTTSVSNRLTVDVGSGDSVTINSNTGYNAPINYSVNNALQWTTQALGDGSGAFRFYYFPTGVERARFTSAGELLVGKTSATANGGVLQISNGITFPATQSACSDANTLDDYEEGSWTGTLKGSVSDPTTPVTATGYYTKIGRSVTVVIEFSNVNNTGASGLVTVAGLPFTCFGSAHCMGSCGTYNFTFANSSTSAFAYAEKTSTRIIFLVGKSAAIWEELQHSAGSGRYLYVATTYFV